MKILEPILDYLEREGGKPLSSRILQALGSLRNEEQRRKRAMYPPRRVVHRRLFRAAKET